MNWWLLSILLVGGLALFLHGMNVMTDGLKSVAGSGMRAFLHSMTRNRWTSLLAGTGITAVIQSSSVTTVLAVGFVSAGLLSFQSTLGLILGANLGTTITAQIIAFKITQASWLMIAFGFLFTVVFSKKSFRDVGTVILGLGLVFLGMNVMNEATEPLKTYEPFIRLMKELDNYIWGVLVGLVFTAAVQSSSATTGVVIILASQGLIGVGAGIAIILGGNIGTCVTAVFSAIGKPRDAMRVAFSHVLFNLVGAIIWFAFIDQLGNLVQLISEAQPARQIANAHTIFNLANTLIFIWLVNPISKIVLWILPQKKEKKKKLFPELHHFYAETPSMAIILIQKAILKMGKQTLSILEQGINIGLRGSRSELVALREKDEWIDGAQKEILNFLRFILSTSISSKETEKLGNLIETINIIETAADLITTDLVEAAEHRLNKNFSVSSESAGKLTNIYMLAYESFNASLEIFSGKKEITTKMFEKEEFKSQLQSVRLFLNTRLSSNSEEWISKFRFETEVLEIIRRLHSLARRLERKAI